MFTSHIFIHEIPVDFDDIFVPAWVIHFDEILLDWNLEEILNVFVNDERTQGGYFFFEVINLGKWADTILDSKQISLYFVPEKFDWPIFVIFVAGG